MYDLNEKDCLEKLINRIPIRVSNSNRLFYFRWGISINTI